MALALPFLTLLRSESVIVGEQVPGFFVVDTLLYQLYCASFYCCKMHKSFVFAIKRRRNNVMSGSKRDIRGVYSL